MRLLVVSQYFWPENFRVNDLVAELVERGHQVTVLTGRPNYPDGRVFADYREDPAYFAEYRGARVVRVPMSTRGSNGVTLLLNYFTFAAGAAVFGPWKLRGEAFDAIFVFEPSPITVGIPAAVMRAVKKAPVAFWVLDLWPETLSAIGVVRSKTVLGLVGKLVSWIYRRCDLILAQSKSFIAQIRQYAGHDNIAYFPSWSDTVTDLDGIEPAGEVPVAEDSFNVMFAGNIGDAQDFPAVLAAAERLKEYRGIRWLIVGDGRMSGWVADEVKRRGLESSVILLGRYPVSRMPSFYKHADALMVSLKDEPIFAMTIPGKVQSYLAAGIPVLGMLNGEGADVISDAGAGLTCPAGDYEGLAEAVLNLAEMSAEQREKMGRNGRTLCEAEFNRDKLITELERMLTALRHPG